VSDKFTPGPWHWVDRDTDEPWNFSERHERLTEEAQYKFAAGVSLRTVKENATSYGGYLPEFIAEAEEIKKADALLIAASPDLLAALRKIEALSKGWDSEGSTGPVEPLSWETVARMAMDYAQAAIAKATEETHGT